MALAALLHGRGKSALQLLPDRLRRGAEGFPLVCQLGKALRRVLSGQTEYFLAEGGTGFPLGAVGLLLGAVGL